MDSRPNCRNKTASRSAGGALLLRLEYEKHRGAFLDSFQTKEFDFCLSTDF